MAEDHHRLAAALDHVADTVEEAAGEQRQAAQIARDTARARRDDQVDEPSTIQSARRVVELLGRSAERLATAAAGLRRGCAAALADQGLSIREIGQRLGVSHQRVSVLLTRHRSWNEGQGRR